MTMTKESATTRVPLSVEERQQVLDQLERMLASPLFNHSKRYAPFLQHVVQKTLGGQDDSLRERVLGIELFGRAPDYDSNNDPVVRVTAGEVRKRIAQYYDDSMHRSELRIDLPIGSYVAQFHSGLQVDEEHRAAAKTSMLKAEPAPTQEPNSGARLNEPKEPAWFPAKPLTTAFLVAAVLVSAGLVWKFEHRDPSSLNAVWGNLLAPQSALVIAVGEPPPLHPEDDRKDEPSARQHLRDYHISLSDLQALIRVIRLLDHRGNSYRVQPADATSLADLRQEPAILLGGLDNSWTLRAQQSLRYRLETDGNGIDWISDSHDPGARKWSVDFNRPYSQVTTDYAIVALLRDPGTQQPTLIIAGMGENGTKAASEFITDDAQLHNALGDVMRNSGGSNFEVVITTEVVNGSSGAPVVLVKEVW
jgi:hypothetical protein